MNYQTVPLTTALNQTMQLNLTVDGNPLTLNIAVNWSVSAGQWLISIADAANNLLISNIPLVTGVYPAANILSQYGYMRIGSLWLLATGQNALGTPTAAPTADNLTTAFTLLWGDTIP